MALRLWTLASVAETGGKVMAYKVEVIADSSGRWCGNALVFATKTEAEQYAKNLFMRWTSVREWRVVETEAEPNYSEKGKS